MRKRPKDKYQI